MNDDREYTINEAHDPRGRCSPPWLILGVAAAQVRFFSPENPERVFMSFTSSEPDNYVRVKLTPAETNILRIWYRFEFGSNIRGTK